MGSFRAVSKVLGSRILAAQLVAFPIFCLADGLVDAYGAHAITAHVLTAPIRVLANHCREHQDALCCSSAFLKPGLEADDGLVEMTAKLAAEIRHMGHSQIILAVVLGAANYGVWRALTRRSEATQPVAPLTVPRQNQGGGDR
jgi:hypothetical protein